METENNRFKVFSRRAAILAGTKFTLFSILAGRMYYLQVIEAEQYRMLAEENRISLRLLPPPRGRIFDRFGTELATNRQNYRAVLVPEQTASVEDTLDSLAAIIDIPDHRRRRILREVGRQREFLPVTVVENLSWENFARVNVRSPDLPGIQPDVGETRFYPFGQALAHVVGYVAPVSEAEMTDDPLLQLPGFRIGKSGIERAFDAELRGSAGNTQVEVNAYGRVIRELNRKDGEPGRDVTLTLDMEIQSLVDERLAGESASVVVLDVHSGDLIADVSSPGFDPNAFNIGLTQSQWLALRDSPRAPLTNKSIAGQYPPGSVFKVVVALAALESGIIDENHQVHCTGSIQFGDNRFHCWKEHGHGTLGLISGISESCDLYFYDVARRTGIDRIAQMARAFGFGSTLGLELPGEKPGLVPDRAWKMANYGVPWQQGETLVAGIGQGFLLATPLQLAVMTARIANGGLAVRPRIILDGAERAAPESLGISKTSLDLVRDGMNGVTNRQRGTAFAARIRSKDMAMAGKSGTSQVRRISRAERLAGVRKNEDIEWLMRDHAIFVAYAPVASPRYAISVIVEHGGGGSKTAAPIARDVLLAVQKRDPSARPVLARGIGGAATGASGSAGP